MRTSLETKQRHAQGGFESPITAIKNYLKAYGTKCRNLYVLTMTT